MKFDNLYDFFLNNSIIFAVAYGLKNKSMSLFGQKDSLPYDGLFQSLFGDEDCIIRLNEFLKGQILPQSFAQGDLTCLIIKPNNDEIIGLFYFNKADPLESYQHTIKINKEVIDILEKCSN